MNKNREQLFSEITATQANITRAIGLLTATVAGLSDRLESLQQKESAGNYGEEVEANSQAESLA